MSLLRLSSQGVHSFISYYSCPRSTINISNMRYSLFLYHTRYAKVPNNPRDQFSTRFFHVSRPSLAPKDPYQVIGVSRDATPAEIKKVYFSLARKYHPDTNPDKNAQEKFVEIQEAYDILKDEKKRAAFDQYGAASQQPGFDPEAFARNPFGGGFGSAFGRGGGQSDLFDQLFGALGGRGHTGGSSFTQNVRGADIEASVGVSFMEAAKGTSRTIKVNPVVDCNTCTGTGLRAGSQRSKCPTCNGSGTRTFVIDSGFQMASTCPTCQGVGTVIPRGHHCRECDGIGKVRSRKSVKVDIPAGIEDGMTIRVPNAGDAPGHGKGPTGDLLVRVNVAASKTFRRQGSNVYHDARIPLHIALLGGRARVPTLDGDVDVRVPGGTQQGQEMVLKNCGIQPVFGGEKGDLFVTFTVQIPRSLTDRQREILQEYADDVEGRSVKKSTRESQEPTSQADVNRKTFSTSSDLNAPLDHDNGTAPFSSSASHRTDDNWLSRLRRKIREFTQR
ncbi:DnaJ protein [Multifurca ochricompacta]|uniref:DnaJ homolog 1, mitochondrial n=1 Tax=Multifurca ochricompacta TaxID=376703 RepID=A0AAD4QUG0_9AGAM|nr:DnaJ protein [Multifurca ochricompacta]